MKDVNIILTDYFQMYFKGFLIPQDSKKTTSDFLDSISSGNYNLQTFNPNIVTEDSYEAGKYAYTLNRYLRKLGKDSIDKNRTFYKISFSESLENQFFRLITNTNAPKLYHYTSLESLVSILKNNQIRFSSIASLNDKGELDYFDKIYNSEKRKLDMDIAKKNPELLNLDDQAIKSLVKSIVNNTLANNIFQLQEYSNSNSTKFHPKTIESFNKRFLLSCSSHRDKLDQWRLYGNDGKGVCIELSVKKEFFDNYEYNDFYIGKLLYGEEFIKQFVNFQYSLLDKENIYVHFNKLNIWKHFFKSIDWQNENEIRIFNYTSETDTSNSEWGVNKFGILTKYLSFELDILPINISRIILGPKILEPELANQQLRQFLREKHKNNIPVVNSEITYYR